jgi:cytidylate kinase
MEGITQNFVITIGRQMGSGGRLLGRKLAERLGVRFFDKELLMEAAREAGVCTEFFERNDERPPRYVNSQFNFAFGLNPMAWFDSASSITDDCLYNSQCEFIRHEADKESCIIVGRTADYVLRDRPNVVNIFVVSDPDDCVQRVMQRDGVKTPEEARRIIERANKSRATYYNFYTDKIWGDSTSYDLTFNLSRIGIDAAIELVITFLKQRLDFVAQNHLTSNPQ